MLEKMRDYRKQKGWTLKDLAKKTGVTSISIGRYETGKREPNLTTLVKIADVLEVTVDDLLTKSH